MRHLKHLKDLKPVREVRREHANRISVLGIKFTPPTLQLLYLLLTAPPLRDICCSPSWRVHCLREVRRGHANCGACYRHWYRHCIYVHIYLTHKHRYMHCIYCTCMHWYMHCIYCTYMHWYMHFIHFTYCIYKTDICISYTACTAYIWYIRCIYCTYMQWYMYGCLISYIAAPPASTSTANSGSSTLITLLQCCLLCSPIY